MVTDRDACLISVKTQHKERWAQSKWIIKIIRHAFTEAQIIEKPNKKAKAELCTKVFSTIHLMWNGEFIVTIGHTKTQLKHRPNVPLNVQNSILARLIELISGVSEYNKCRHSLAVKRRRKEKKQKQKENISTDETKDSSLNMEMDALNENIVSSSTAHDEALGILKQMTVGINAVTKRLETQCLVSRRALSSSGANLNLSQKREGEPQKDEDEVNYCKCPPITLLITNICSLRKL